MDSSYYQKESFKTVVDLGDDTFLKHLENASIGMSVESNEVLQHIQRNVFCGKDLDKDHLLDECGDVLWYLSYLLSTLGYTLEECMCHNLKKVHSKYPERVNTAEQLSFDFQAKEV